MTYCWDAVHLFVREGGGEKAEMIHDLMLCLILPSVKLEVYAAYNRACGAPVDLQLVKA